MKANQGKLKQFSRENLRKDISLKSEIAQEIVFHFHDMLVSTGNEKIFLKMEKWKDLFKYLHGNVFLSKHLEHHFKQSSFQRSTNDIDNLAFIFSIYTYYSIIVRVISAEICSRNRNLTQKKSFLNEMLACDSMNEALIMLEAPFDGFINVGKVLDDDMFSWYLDAAISPKLESMMKSLLVVLSHYDFTKLVDLRDFSRMIYEEIIPQEIRHDLGEFHTPKWLASLVINEIGYAGEKHHRILDPGCGSGIFIVECIYRFKERNNDLDKSEQLKLILSNIIGIDINPIACLSARMNYILAIIDLIPPSATSIDVPIYLADSVLGPFFDVKSGQYIISTSRGNVSIPKRIVKKDILEELGDNLENNLMSGKDWSHFVISPGLIQYREPIKKVYKQLIEMKNQGENIPIRNILSSFFSPLFIEKFDFVIGNPPWIRWEFLSREYREKLKHLYLDIYHLFDYKGQDAMHGYAHDDISILFFTATCDKYLKMGGKLGYLLKKNLFTNEASRVFRSFEIRKEESITPICVEKVIDLEEINPFRPINAESCIAIFIKGKKNTYPVRFLKWKHVKETRKVSTQDDIGMVLQKVKIKEKHAIPDPIEKKNDAPWVLIEDQRDNKITGMDINHYKPRHGVVNDLVSVFFVDIKNKMPDGKLEIRNRVFLDKRSQKVKPSTAIVKPDLIYPCIKSRHLKKWKLDLSRNKIDYIIMTQKKSGKENLDLKNKYPGIYNYLLFYKDQLENRHSIHFKGKPFYSMYAVGEYTFQTYKVAWKSMSKKPEFVVISTIDDHFLGRKLLIPDNPIGYISTSLEEEAHFICGVLNSAILNDFFLSRQRGTKYPLSQSLIQKAPVPRYDPSREIHLKISFLSRQLHDEDNPRDVAILEKKLNEQVKILLGSNHD
ncbi:MAG: Eco57I restriction-modification methylase domain-containing protein [Promethearchaeota archaeon]